MTTYGSYGMLTLADGLEPEYGGKAVRQLGLLVQLANHHITQRNQRNLGVQAMKRALATYCALRFVLEELEVLAPDDELEEVIGPALTTELSD